jgi:hypothetical protein
MVIHSIHETNRIGTNHRTLGWHDAVKIALFAELPNDSAHLGTEVKAADSAVFGYILTGIVVVASTEVALVSVWDVTTKATATGSIVLLKATATGSIFVLWNSIRCRVQRVVVSVVGTVDDQAGHFRVNP